MAKIVGGGDFKVGNQFRGATAKMWFPQIRNVARINVESQRVKINVADLFISCGGRLFGNTETTSWIESNNGTARKNSYTDSDTITCAGYIIESLLRDECFAERDLIITSKTSNTVYVVNGLKYIEADYYNYAYVHNVTRDDVDTISDFEYSGGNRIITTSTSHAGWAATDKIYITNIQGGNKIDHKSFDQVFSNVVYLGTTSGTSANKLIDSGQSFTTSLASGVNYLIKNTTDNTYTQLVSIDSDTQLTIADDIFVSGEDYYIMGIRCDNANKWYHSCCIYKKESAEEIINSLLFQSWCILIKSYKQIKILPLDVTYLSVDTWSSPLLSNGNPMVSAQLSSIGNVFTNYSLFYHKDLGTGIYNYKLSVDKNNNSSGLSAEKTLCSNAEANYKISRKFTYNADYIDDTWTATELMKKIVAFYCKQRLIVTWYGDFKTYCKYEIGDQVKINYSTLIPDSLNNSAKFIIIGKQIIPHIAETNIVFTLIELS